MVTVCGLNLEFVMPVVILKSAFKRDIFLLSLGLVEFGFFGLLPKTMSEVRWEWVGGSPP